MSSNNAELISRPLPSTALDPRTHAFFFDMDGTLVEFAEQPEAVAAPPRVLSVLGALLESSGGALALISGRTIASLDRITDPRRFAAAGVHGLERRSAVVGYEGRGSCTALAAPRAALRAFAVQNPQLLLEDKQVSLALHYRGAPHLGPQALQLVYALARAQPDLKVQEGAMVVELLPAIAGKARALAAFMDEAPFRGRRPVFVGDDLTDEAAFEWVNAADGLSVAVAPPRATTARTALPSVAAVHRWLAAVAEDRANA